MAEQGGLDRHSALGQEQIRRRRQRGLRHQCGARFEGLPGYFLEADEVILRAAVIGRFAQHRSRSPKVYQGGNQPQRWVNPSGVSRNRKKGTLALQAFDVNRLAGAALWRYRSQGRRQVMAVRSGRCCKGLQCL